MPNKKKKDDVVDEGKDDDDNNNSSSRVIFLVLKIKSILDEGSYITLHLVDDGLTTITTTATTTTTTIASTDTSTTVDRPTAATETATAPSPQFFASTITNGSTSDGIPPPQAALDPMEAFLYTLELSKDIDDDTKRLIKKLAPVLSLLNSTVAAPPPSAVMIEDASPVQMKMRIARSEYRRLGSPKVGEHLYIHVGMLPILRKERLPPGADPPPPPIP